MSHLRQHTKRSARTAHLKAPVEGLIDASSSVSCFQPRTRPPSKQIDGAIGGRAGHRPRNLVVLAECGTSHAGLVRDTGAHVVRSLHGCA